MTEKFKKSLSFVVSHYRPEAFVPRGRYVLPRPWWRRMSVAASVAAGVFVASALVYNAVIDRPSAVVEPSQAPVSVPVTSAPVATAQTVQRLEFADMPLSQVIDNIQTAYNVTVTGMTPDDASRTLTLSYEGNADDLVAAINEILGTNLTVESK